MRVPKDPPKREEIEQALTQKTDGRKELKREYRLITPLFGGGEEPRLADSVTTVRPSEVKGQLRFWWRAIRGWQAEGDLSTLLKREEEIWGGITKTQQASRVIVEVETLNPGEPKNPFTKQEGKRFPKNDPNIAPGYVAFPLRETKDDPRNYPVRVGVRFRLRLRFPASLKEEVLAALWAWETFGGIGGRTRRGFGAFLESEVGPISEATIRENLKRYSRQGGWPKYVPHLTPESVIHLHPGSWQETVRCYERFRQWRTRDDRRNPGRSRWPEPDAIRRLTGKWDPRHAPEHPVNKFPRGQFGLPIIFHFKREKGKRVKDEQDPPDSTLKGASLERHASPLAFRPLSKDGPTLVYVLEGNRKLPEAYALDTAPGKPIEVELEPDEAQKIEPLARAGGLTDPVLAFVEWLKGGCKR